MKIRNGFVSNSSSSSFIVNVKTGSADRWDLDAYLKDCGDKSYEITLPIKDGTYSFGWETKRWYDVVSKINYAVIQAFHSSKSYDNRLIIEKALEKRIKEVKGEDADIYVNWDYNAVLYDSGTSWAHIDHQSLWYEAEECYSMPPVHDIFKSVENMENYLFNSNAYVQGGNDNGGQDFPEYKESLDVLYGKWFGLHREFKYDIYDELYDKDDNEVVVREPLIEGTCKDCGSPVEYRVFRQKENNEIIKNWDEVKKYHNIESDDDKIIYSDGYYMCSNPDCPNHKRFYTDDYHCDDIPFLIRNKESV